MSIDFTSETINGFCHSTFINENFQNWIIRRCSKLSALFQFLATKSADLNKNDQISPQCFTASENKLCSLFTRNAKRQLESLYSDYGNTLDNPSKLTQLSNAIRDDRFCNYL